RGSRCLDPDERLLEAEAERVRHSDHLQDVLAAETCIPRPDRRLRDAEPGSDGPEGLTSVRLERLDDPLVQRVDPRRGADRPSARLGQGRLSDRSTQSEAIRTMRCAFGQCKALLELALRMLD